MLRRLLLAYQRQMLVWRLAALHGWLEEFNYVERNLTVQRRRTQNAIEMTKVRLAKLDGEQMLMGVASVVMK